jgi:hypothetical protein
MLASGVRNKEIDRQVVRMHCCVQRAGADAVAAMWCFPMLTCPAGGMGWGSFFNYKNN